MAKRPTVKSRQLAEAIANDLFVNGSGQRADRLVLTIDGPKARNLGGWSFPAVIDRIEQHLVAQSLKEKTS